MDLKEIREQIDLIDDDLVRLFIMRMNLSLQVANYKKEHNLPIHVPAREQEILQTISEQVDPEMSDYVCNLYTLIFKLSKDLQSKHLGIDTEVV